MIYDFSACFPCLFDEFYKCTDIIHRSFKLKILTALL